MSSRPGVVTKQSAPADGGESPNRYAPFVTAELRVFWPPLATDEQIEDAITRAVAETRKRIANRRSGL
ncbi:hypothetical protein SEA_AMYEV_34 [Arthrobacter phage Amyev]|uniref:Uncharacterized protein n=1 Tax=Arthrobacter phage Amyev TaxID=2832315 RepID=A0AA48Y3T0_9CAUD|nr:hypothetical protein PQD88_gp34 [Arthrobacter phage Amyev]UIW13450.1 hypothetical protein SEA_AMYEV_34 [Arthrobacter phage Amyev]